MVRDGGCGRGACLLACLLLWRECKRCGVFSLSSPTSLHALRDRMTSRRLLTSLTSRVATSSACQAWVADPVAAWTWQRCSRLVALSRHAYMCHALVSRTLCHVISRRCMLQCIRVILLIYRTILRCSRVHHAPLIACTCHEVFITHTHRHTCYSCPRRRR